MPRERALVAAVVGAGILGLLAWRRAQAAEAAGGELWIPFETFETAGVVDPFTGGIFTAPIAPSPFLPADPYGLPDEILQGDPFLRGELPPADYLLGQWGQPAPACPQIFDGARAAGFTADGARTLSAIARAESGCRNDALCASCAGVREYSVGALQLNLYAHPNITADCARDPYCAAAAAYQISGGGANFRPWTTYTSGAYRAYL